jgi:tRNA (Thr-GGU) A37 N-methylase
MLNETPLIDIKPFFPKYDNQTDVKGGWLDSRQAIDITTIRSDGRFK